LTIPPLRQRPEDLPEIVDQLLVRMGVPPEKVAAVCSGAFLAALRRHTWPGNVRELRNHLEARLVLSPALTATAGVSTGRVVVPYPEARERAMNAFEREYLEDLMRHFPGEVARAAVAARMDRVFLYRLLK